MCGINGFNFEDKKLIDLMNKTIKHRGPDDEGIYSRKGVSLGHLRLSIQDLSEKGHQPMIRKGMSITYNGEIYNFQELKTELKKLGHKFDSNSDTEVILASYLEWGESCVKKFNGMWAFCIFDQIKNEFFLSRDRFGKKPLYYHLKDNKFIFSSEMKVLLRAGVKFEIDKVALNEYFTYRFTYDERCMIKDVKNFKPGHSMIFDLNTNKIKSYVRYYDIKRNKNKLSYKEVKTKLKNLLDDSVRLRMVSDVPVASFLSGGIDSSLVTYFAKKYNSDLNTFSIGFDTVNELPHAKIVSEYLGTKHHEFIIDKDNVLSYLDDMVYHMDEPIGADPGFLPMYVLSKEVSKKYKVVLSGDGADEIFTGYDRYKLFYYGEYLKHFVIKHFDHSILKRLTLMRGKSTFRSFMEVTRVFDDEEMNLLGLKPEFDEKTWNSINVKDTLIKSQIFDIKTLLPKDLFMKADKMSSAFGLEQRVPFMDDKIVEFGLGLKLKHRLFGWNEKKVLKDIASEVLPKEISKRRKHGFNVPIDYWFTNSLADKLRELLFKSKHELYDKEYVLKLLLTLEDAKGGFKARNVIAQKLWTVLIFEMWYERFSK